ncbi:MAG: hypothetical protein E7264_03060 [Lachnospiraceae bacterium]|nr:hypothetical protein [Lachnospiraceae bacterium]
MKLKETSYLKRSNIIFTFLLVCVIIMSGMYVQAASKHTTKPSVSVHSGNDNPFKHDTGKCTITYCTRHTGKKDLNASKVRVTLEVKSTAKKTKTVSTYYESIGVGRGELAYCDWNSGSKSFSLKTAEKDKYKAKARYVTGDFFCIKCVESGKSDAEKYSNKTSSWKSE